MNRHHPGHRRHAAPGLTTRGRRLVVTAVLLSALAPAAARSSGVCLHCVSNNDTTSTPGIVATPSMLVSQAAVPPIAFVGADGRLRCALPAAPGWDIQVADTVAGAGGCSMALDPLGEPVIAYHDAQGTLFRASRLGGTWLREPIDPTGVVPGSTSLRATPSGFAIAFVDVATGLLRYAAQDAGGWTIENVAQVVAAEAYPSLLVDGAARAISYYDALNGGLRLAQRSAAGTWTTEAVDATADVGGYTSLVGGPSHGGFGIAYYDFADADLRYARTVPGGGWAVETVDGAGIDAGRFCSAIAFGGTPDDHVGIAYDDRTHGDLRYAMRRAGNWIVTAADTTGHAGAFVSCLGTPVPADTIGIAYVERTQGELRYLWRANALTAVAPERVPPAPLHVAWTRDAGGGGTLRFTVPAAGPARVRVYDTLGRLTATPLCGLLHAGATAVRWDGRDERGRALAAGVFLVRVDTPTASGTAHAVLLR